MNSKDFFYTVAKLRDAQFSYSRVRSSSNLALVRKLEREIDSEIARVYKLVGAITPPSHLFSQDD